MLEKENENTRSAAFIMWENQVVLRACLGAPGGTPEKLTQTPA